METFTTTQVIDLSGVSLRQIHYWIEHGWIIPEISKGTGSGFRHVWSETNIEILNAVRERIEWGLTPERAFQKDSSECPKLPEISNG